MANILDNRAVETLFNSQLNDWEQAKHNYEALSNISSKTLSYNGLEFKVQFNPARIVSSAAKVDAQSIKERKCFLCAQNRPLVQKGIAYSGLAGEYEVLVNPFPIFPKHLTLPDKNHVRQQIKGRFIDMLNLSASIDDYVLFYNGPKCGASAPDHMHFQAGNKGFLPLEKCISNIQKKEICSLNGAKLFSTSSFISGSLLIEGDKTEALVNIFDMVYNLLPIADGEWEPMMNILSWYSNNKYYVIVFLRKQHRPSCYFAQGDDNILISPASVDLGGVFITPLEKDFNKISASDIDNILREITISNESIETLFVELNKKNNNE